MVDDQHVFAWLKKQKKDVLLACLRAAFDVMNAKQRRVVFADVIQPEVTTSGDGDKLRAEIEKFRRDSLARKYYAPFNVNSKNFMVVPEKTKEWCDRFVGFVLAASRLTISGEHTQAVGCFALLFELVEAVDSGEDIFFAEETGSWMIPTDETAWLNSYLTSLAATCTPEQFTTAVIPIIERDSLHSFAGKVYTAAGKAANPQQKTHLQAEVRRRKIRTH